MSLCPVLVCARPNQSDVASHSQVFPWDYDNVHLAVSPIKVATHAFDRAELPALDEDGWKKAKDEFDADMKSLEVRHRAAPLCLSCAAFHLLRALCLRLSLVSAVSRKGRPLNARVLSRTTAPSVMTRFRTSCLLRLNS